MRSRCGCAAVALCCAPREDEIREQSGPDPRELAKTEDASADAAGRPNASAPLENLYLNGAPHAWGDDKHEPRRVPNLAVVWLATARSDVPPSRACSKSPV